MDGLHGFLLHESSPSGLFYIADIQQNDRESSIVHKMDHLVCFMGGKVLQHEIIFICLFRLLTRLFCK